MYMSVVLVNFAAALASLSRPVAGVWQTFTPTPHPRVPLDSPNATALDQYVWKPDLSFGYEVSGGMQTAPGCTVHVLNVTSQTWLTQADFETEIGHVWKHWVVVIIPDVIEQLDSAVMYITGGDNHDGPPIWKGNEDIELAITLAISVKSIAVVLFQTPNQPIQYADDPLKEQRSEDASIAFTWDHFYRHPDQPEWLLRLPMTKGAVRAMDAVEDFVAKTTGNTELSRWAVAGASKRGWTTWTTCAVDSRVITIAPIVLDVMNLVKTMHRWYQAMGAWTFAVRDYYKLNFTSRLDDPVTTQMFDIVDVGSYIERYATVPKLVVTAGLDEFLEVDDTYSWYSTMPGETHLLMVQDADHSMSTGLEQVVPGISSFFKAVFAGRPRPSLSWTFGPHPSGGTGNSITLDTSEPPARVEVWHADTVSKTRRDWRLATGASPCPTKVLPTPAGKACFQPVLWYGSKPANLTATRFQAAFDPPPDGGWRAYFVTAEFAVPGSAFKFKMTTQVNVAPDVLPFGPCSGVGCRGSLV